MQAWERRAPRCNGKHADPPGALGRPAGPATNLELGCEAAGQPLLRSRLSMVLGQRLLKPPVPAQPIRRPAGFLDTSRLRRASIFPAWMSRIFLLEPDTATKKTAAEVFCFPLLSKMKQAALVSPRPSPSAPSPPPSPPRLPPRPAAGAVTSPSPEPAPPAPAAHFRVSSASGGAGGALGEVR